MPSHRRRIHVRSRKLQLLMTRRFSQPLQALQLKKLAGRVPPTSRSNHKTVFKTASHLPIITVDTFTVTLPVPPSINHQYATVNGRRLLSSAGRAYKTQVGQHVCIALAQSASRVSLKNRLQSGPLALSIRFFFASALRRDLDGGLKIAQDAVCEGLGLNDNRIVETHLYKHVDRADPRIEVSLSVLSSPPQPV
jgi:crossover junction endodeoxyribonuclease RusA